MAIRAKFQCQEVAKTTDVTRVKLTPVTGNTDDNKSWSKWTPAGQIDMLITNPDAADAFVPGEEYFVDFKSVKQ